VTWTRQDPVEAREAQRAKKPAVVKKRKPKKRKA
jgi:hypothetical protein